MVKFKVNGSVRNRSICYTESIFPYDNSEYYRNHTENKSKIKKKMSGSIPAPEKIQRQQQNR